MHRTLFLECILMVMMLSRLSTAHDSDVNPCFSNPCDLNAECNPGADNGNFICTCNDPFVGNGTFCADVCENYTCPYYSACKGTFKNDTLSSECYCDEFLFYKDELGNCACKYFCNSDVLFSSSELRCNEHCTHASYSCIEGFYLESVGHCREITKCDPLNPCGLNGDCTEDLQQLGGYTCDCDPGFVLNNVTCVDVDECKENTTVCVDGAICENTLGGYVCICDKRHTFPVKNTNGDLLCLNIDECGLDNGGCSQNCHNSHNGPQCSCISGFYVNTTSKELCDLDETSEFQVCGSNSTLQCQPGGVCIVSNGTESCMCFKGYVSSNFDNDFCYPSESCNSIHHNCHHGISCKNTTLQPGYLCECPKGFRRGPLGRCYEYDQCLAQPFLCGDNAVCQQHIDGYKCICDKGYHFAKHNDTVCVEIDYCAMAVVNERCKSEKKLCQNIPGGYECYCAISSVPVVSGENEVCLLPPDDDGYIVDLSMDLLGSDLDFSYDGQRALTRRIKKSFETMMPIVGVRNIEVTSFKPNKDGAEVQVSVYLGKNVPLLKDFLLQTCSRYNYTDNVEGCVLPPDLVVNKNTLQVKNHSMCKLHEDLCGPLANCVECNGNYSCECKEGYEVGGYLDHKKPICIDIDECEIDSLKCDFQGMKCVNVIGGYNCTCDTCFVPLKDNSHCIHICQTNPCKNNGKCVETRMEDNCGYSCLCDAKYLGINCEEVNSEITAANINTAITGGVLGGVLLLTFIIGGFIIYRGIKRSGYFSFHK